MQTLKSSSRFSHEQEKNLMVLAEMKAKPTVEELLAKAKKPAQYRLQCIGFTREKCRLSQNAPSEAPTTSQSGTLQA